MQQSEQESLMFTEHDYTILHNEIIHYGSMTISCYVEFAKKLKQMRDGKLYRAVGIDSFGEYVEQQVGIKERQAYNYIKVYEEYSEEFLQSNAKIGITKLSLLAPLTVQEREDLMAEVDVENTSVKELQKEIEARDKKIEQMRIDFDALQDETSSKLEVAAREAEAAQKERDAMAKQVDDTIKLRTELDKLKKEKNKLSEDKAQAEKELSELRKAPTKVEVQTVDNPVTVKELESATARIAELEQNEKILTKKLQLASDQTMMKFKSKFEDFQIIIQDILQLTSAMDEEKRKKCQAALKSVIGGLNL